MTAYLQLLINKATFLLNSLPKENASYKCVSLIMLDSVISVNKKYYPQTYTLWNKYEIKQIWNKKE